jgi:exodeoxyribonuclease-1
MNYVFYDFETTGTNRFFDQPVQIAAILVNEEFEILDQINEKCKLKDGIVPYPEALLINKINTETLKNAQSFFKMMDIVHKKFSEWSPATFIGYNSIFFDEVVLRQSLYQSLYDPYITNTNNNRRADLYNIILGLARLNVDLIKIGFNPNTEKESFKLEYLAQANNIEQKTAHDALSDVHATIGLAKLIKLKYPEYWNQCMSISHVQGFRDYLETDNVFVRAPSHPSHKYKPISYLTHNPNNLKELAFFDLENNAEDHYDSRVQKIISLIENKNKIIKLIYINQSPIILNSDYIKETKIFSDIELNKFKLQSQNLSKQESFINNLNQALVDRQDDRAVNQAVPTELEAQIYSGFSSNQDKEKMKNFKNCTELEKKYIMSKEFEDPRLREIAYRIIYAESPEILSKQQLKDRKNFIAEKALSKEEKVDWCTIDKAKKDISKLKENDKYQNQKEFIDEIEKYIFSEEKRYKEYLIS